MLGNIGNLRPDDQTALITQVVEILVVLVVGQTNGVCAHLTNQIDVLKMVGAGDGIAFPGTVLMAGNAAQRIGLTVQDEAAFGVNLKAAAAEADTPLIEQRIAVQQFRAQRVEMRVFAPVPEMSIFQREVRLGVGSRRLGGSDSAFPIKNCPAQRLAARQAGQERLGTDIGIGALHRGRDLDARRAIIVQIKPTCSHAEQRDRAVQSAVKSEVGFLRIHMVIGGIVNLHENLVLLIQDLGQIDPPGGIAAIVAGNIFSIHNHLC